MYMTTPRLTPVAALLPYHYSITAAMMTTTAHLHRQAVGLVGLSHILLRQTLHLSLKRLYPLRPGRGHFSVLKFAQLCVGGANEGIGWGERGSPITKNGRWTSRTLLRLFPE